MSRKTWALLVTIIAGLLGIFLLLGAKYLPEWFIKDGLVVCTIAFVVGIIGYFCTREKHKIESKFPMRQISQTGNDSTAVQIGQIGGNVAITTESHRDLTQKVKIKVGFRTVLGKDKDGEYTQVVGEPQWCIKVNNPSLEFEAEVTHMEYAGSSTIPIGLGDGSLPRHLKPSEMAEWLISASCIPNDQDPELKFRVQLSDGSIFWSEKDLNVFGVGNVSDQSKNIVTGIKYPPDDPKNEEN